MQPIWVQKAFEFHHCLKEWRQLTPARSQHECRQVWEGIAGRLTFLNHLHVETFVLIFAGDVLLLP